MHVVFVTEPTLFFAVLTVQVQQEGNTAMAELQLKWLQLQTHINCLIDSDLDKISNDANKLQGIRQVGCGACWCCSGCWCCSDCCVVVVVGVVRLLVLLSM